MDWLNIFRGLDLVQALVLLIMLYAIALINRAIRLLQFKVESLERDNQLINEEIKMLSPHPAEKSAGSGWAGSQGEREKEE